MHTDHVSAHRAREVFTHMLATLEEKQPGDPISIDGLVAATSDLLAHHATQEKEMVDFIQRQATENFSSPHTLNDPPPTVDAQEERPLPEDGRRFPTTKK